MAAIAAERSIADVAARQRGVVTAEQLREAGVSRATLRRRVRAGALHRLRRGVYLVGHAVAPEGAAEMAALLACGRGSFISHRSAARLWKLPAFLAWDRPIDVTVPGRDPGRKPGLRIWRTGSLSGRDVRRPGGIPATAPARTLLDLAVVLPFHELERALADARGLGIVRDRDLVGALERSPGRRGARTFRRLVELAHAEGPTRSDAERKLLALLRAAGLPPPRTNARVGRVEVDFLWHERRLVVEVDGFAFHSGQEAFERDRSRDAALVADGHAVIRVTWRQLTVRPESVVARIAAALATRPGSP